MNQANRVIPVARSPTRSTPARRALGRKGVTARLVGEVYGFLGRQRAHRAYYNVASTVHWSAWHRGALATPGRRLAAGWLGRGGVMAMFDARVRGSVGMGPVRCLCGVRVREPVVAQASVFHGAEHHGRRERVGLVKRQGDAHRWMWLRT